jgi:N-acetylglutamate synthase-like GNAT family acetyltransferase
LFRKAEPKDIDIIHQLLVREAAQGRLDPHLAEEPYRAGFRRNLNNIRKRGRRLDQDVRAQLLVWEKDRQIAGCLVNSAILPEAGNELLMMAVVDEFRGQGVGREMIKRILAMLHPHVDIFARCAVGAEVFFQILLRRGFLPLDITDSGVRVLKLPRLGSQLAEQGGNQQQLEPFVEIPVK